MTRGVTILVGTSYLILLVQSVAALAWDTLHADPLHSQFPIVFRLMLTIPAITLTVLAVVQMLVQTAHNDDKESKQ